jgi:hypothetical protein
MYSGTNGLVKEEGGRVRGRLRLRRRSRLRLRLRKRKCCGAAA